MAIFDPWMPLQLWQGFNQPGTFSSHGKIVLAITLMGFMSLASIAFAVTSIGWSWFGLTEHKFLCPLFLALTTWLVLVTFLFLHRHYQTPVGNYFWHLLFIWVMPLAVFLIWFPILSPTIIAIISLSYVGLQVWIIGAWLLVVYHKEQQVHCSAFICAIVCFALLNIFLGLATWALFGNLASLVMNHGGGHVAFIVASPVLLLLCLCTWGSHVLYLNVMLLDMSVFCSLFFLFVCSFCLVCVCLICNNVLNSQEFKFMI